MLRANVSQVGLLIGGALAIRFLWSVSDVSTARLAGSGKPSSERAGGPGTLLGPEGTGTRGPRVGLWLFVVFRPLRLAPFLFGGVGWACGPVRPPYRIRCLRGLSAGFWWFGGGCGLVSVRVLRTA
jgi:hypothetical protein